MSDCGRGAARSRSAGSAISAQRVRSGGGFWEIQCALHAYDVRFPRDPVA